MRIASLFPHLTVLRLQRVLVAAGQVHLEVRHRAGTGRCPQCHHRSRRIHSAYRRRVADLPVAGQPVVLHVHVRRFRCGNARCPRRTFAEQLPAVVARFARRTEALRRALEHVGLTLGGRPGQRLSRRLGLLATRDNLLHLVRALPEPEGPYARVLGVDELALRRGRVYGTVLVDVERHRPLDLLDDRSAEQFAAWLRERAAPESICRDRAGCFAEGASRGGPDAVQVADRWHRLANLSDAVERVATQHARCWADDPLDMGAPPPAGTDESSPVVGRLTQRHQERYTQVQTLVARGMTISAMATTLHLDRKTVRTFACAQSAEDIGSPRRAGTSPLLAPFLELVNHHWQEGRTDGKRLLDELRQQGYHGSHRTLSRYLTNLRRGAPPRRPTRSASARAVVGLILRLPETLDVTETARLARLCAGGDELATTARLARTFASLVRTRPGSDAFRGWLDEVMTSGITPLVRFATGLRRDEAAVAAGLTLPWSSGVVEGHNTRIKLIKRQMYGRGGFDLLRRRVLLAS